MFAFNALRPQSLGNTQSILREASQLAKKPGFTFFAGAVVKVLVPSAGSDTALLPSCSIPLVDVGDVIGTLRLLSLAISAYAATRGIEEKRPAKVAKTDPRQQMLSAAVLAINNLTSFDKSVVAAPGSQLGDRVLKVIDANEAAIVQIVVAKLIAILQSELVEVEKLKIPETPPCIEVYDRKDASVPADAQEILAATQTQAAKNIIKAWTKVDWLLCDITTYLPSGTDYDITQYWDSTSRFRTAVASQYLINALVGPVKDEAERPVFVQNIKSQKTDKLKATLSPKLEIALKQCLDKQLKKV